MIMVIDGNNLAYRVFHTPQGGLCTKQGEPSGVMLGVMNSIKGLLEKFPETERVVIIWDGGKAKWRKEIYPEYKANRSYGDSPEEKEAFDGLFKQIDVLHEFLPNLAIHSIKIKGWEADDIIAAISNKVGTGHVMIVTSDKDMLQLINDNVSVYTPYKDIVVSPLNFYEVTGVTKDAYIGYRSLLGDTSDNINGVPGIGEKTAKSLMDIYGHIDNILAATGTTKTKLMSSKRTAKIFDPANLKILGINNKIMNFKYVPYDVNVDDEVNKALGSYLDIEETRPLGLQVDSKAVREFCTRWQFVSILAIFSAWIVPFTGLNED